jgi:hypothetical protein
MVAALLRSGKPECHRNNVLQCTIVAPASGGVILAVFRLRLRLRVLPVLGSCTPLASS